MWQDPDLAYEAKKIADAEEAAAGVDAEIQALAKVSCEEYYDERQYGMDPEYDAPDFGDLSPEDVDVLNRALHLTSKIMALPTKEASEALDRVDGVLPDLDDLPF